MLAQAKAFDRFGSQASFDASGSDFRYYPERRHSLALHQVTQRARCRHRLVISAALDQVVVWRCRFLFWRRMTSAGEMTFRNVRCLRYSPIYEKSVK
jgi:hypothetical protein